MKTACGYQNPFHLRPEPELMEFTDIFMLILILFGLRVSISVFFTVSVTLSNRWKHRVLKNR